MNTIEEKLNQADQPAPSSVGEGIPAHGIEPPAEIPPPGRKPLVVALSAIALIILSVIGYWKRASLQQVNPYIPVIIPSLIAGSQIRFKDWNSYNPKSIRYLLLLAVFIACGWGILYQNRQISDKAAAATRADTAQKAQQDNTTQFLSHLGTLSDKIGALQTKVATEELRKELTDVRSELRKTQKAMAPPLVSLLFSFVPFSNPPAIKEVVRSTDVTLPVAADGTVHVEFTVMNMSDIAAVDGELTLEICDQCQFGKEPAGFRHLPGQVATHRTMSFDRLLATTALATMSADITVPPGIDSFPMGIVPRCRNCVVLREPSSGTVRLTRTP